MNKKRRERESVGWYSERDSYNYPWLAIINKYFHYFKRKFSYAIIHKYANRHFHIALVITMILIAPMGPMTPRSLPSFFVKN